MGKDSLIKSTAKKSAKKEEKPKKTVARKKTTAKKEAPKKSVKKAAKSRKPPAKKTSAAKPKPKATATAKPKTTPKPKSKTTAKSKPKAKKPAKKLTTKELLLKSFKPITKIDKPKPVTRPEQSRPSAPPLIDASDPKERTRISQLLFNSYSMKDIKAAAKPPVVKPPVVEVEPLVAEPVVVEPPAESKIVEKRKPEPMPAAQPPSINTNVSDGPRDSNPDPISKAVKLLAAGVGVVILILLMTSYTNSSKYYIEPKDKAIEIWKGRFSPKDRKFYMVLHGTEVLGEPKAVYAREDVYPLIFDYYLGKADTLLEVPGLPDFEGIKAYLHDARKYAIGKDSHKSIAIRLSNIDRMILLYKADVAISQGTVKSLKSALKQLKSAKTHITNTAQGDEIQQKIDLANSMMVALKAKPAKPKQ